MFPFAEGKLALIQTSLSGCSNAKVNSSWFTRLSPFFFWYHTRVDAMEIWLKSQFGFCVWAFPRPGIHSWDVGQLLDNHVAPRVTSNPLQIAGLSNVLLSRLDILTALLTNSVFNWQWLDLDVATCRSRSNFTSFIDRFSKKDVYFPHSKYIKCNHFAIMIKEIRMASEKGCNWRPFK